MTAAIVQAMPIRESGLHVDLNGNGAADYFQRLTGDLGMTELDHRERKRTIIALYAARTAQLKFYPGCQQDGWQDDSRKIRGLAHEMHPTEEEVQIVLAALQERAKKLVDVHWLIIVRIGEVTALKVNSIDFKRKLLHITAALDYATRKESTPKSQHSAAPVPMPELVAKYLQDWIDKRYRPNPDGHLFLNSKDQPYPSDNVVKYGVHRAITKLGIQVPNGVHVGIHCFRHGVTTELLESGTPIHIVTRMMRHGGSKVTLDHYAHIIGDAERTASELFSRRIGAQLESDSELESSSVKTA